MHTSFRSFICSRVSFALSNTGSPRSYRICQFLYAKTARIGVSNSEVGYLLPIYKLFLRSERSNHIHVCWPYLVATSWTRFEPSALYKRQVAGYRLRSTMPGCRSFLYYFLQMGSFCRAVRASAIKVPDCSRDVRCLVNRWLPPERRVTGAKPQVHCRVLRSRFWIASQHRSAMLLAR